MKTLRAKIAVKREIIDNEDDVTIVDDIENVGVDRITSVGIIIDDSAGDETLQTLIPWHRVYEVWSIIEGEMFLAVGE